MVVLASCFIQPVVALQRDTIPTYIVPARIVAVNIPGIGGIRQVGMFHAGGAIPSNPEFLAQTRKHKVLYPTRLLVASQSNFGRARYADTYQDGTILSIDTETEQPLIIPGEFARQERTALNGLVMLYSGHAAEFINHRYNPDARTAALPGISNPRYISVNNAFGRPWFACSPLGAEGFAISSVLDPNGAPLDNAPSHESGGVFTDLSNRRRGAYTQDRIGRNKAGDLLRMFFPALRGSSSGQYSTGQLTHGGLGTAFLGGSPDASGFAVFALAMADGSIAQVHVQDGVDGLAPAGTVSPHPNSEGIIGMAFKWVPSRALFITDYYANRIAVLDLEHDDKHFTVSQVQHLYSPQFDRPTDIAAAVPEIANPRFSSHTTLAGDSDLYLANRGNGSILRLTQTGAVLAKIFVQLPDGSLITGDTVRSLAVSSDAQKIWLALSKAVAPFTNQPGAIIEISGFDSQGAFFGSHDKINIQSAQAQQGAFFFTKNFTPQEGLGPLFNARSCADCHNQPTVGGANFLEHNFVRHIGRLHTVNGRVLSLPGKQFPIAHKHSLHELGESTAPPAGLPSETNVVSLRMPPALYAMDIIDDIPDSAILAHAVSKGDGIYGRPHFINTPTGRKIGRFGWKADKATLEQMVASAYDTELGISNPLAWQYRDTATDSPSHPFDDDGRIIRSVVEFLRSLKQPLTDTKNTKQELTRH